jgi:hypothetical protein
VEEEVERVEDRLAQATVSSWGQTQKLTAEHLRDIGQFVAAAKLDLATLRNTPIDLGQFLNTETIDHKLGQLPAKAREVLKQTFTSVLPEDVAPLTDKLQKAVADAQSKMAIGQTRQSIDVLLSVIPGAGGAGLTAALFDERKINQQKALAGIYSGLMQYLGQEQQQYAAATQVATDQVGKAHEQEAHKIEEAMRKAQAAVRQQVEAIRTADEERLADIKLSGQMEGEENRFVLLDERDYLQDRLQAEKQYGDSHKAIKDALKRDLISVNKDIETATREPLERAARAVSESVRKAAEAQNRMAEIARDGQRLANEIHDEAAKAEAERMRASDTSNSERTIGGLQSRRIDIEAQYKLSGSPTGDQAAAELKATQAIDEQILTAKQQLAQQILEIDQWLQAQLIGDQNGWAKKVDEDQKAVTQGAVNYGLKIEQDNANLALALEQQWSGYFQVFARDLEHSVDDWIRTARNFQKDMRDMGADMVVTWANNAMKMGLQFAEMKAKSLLIHFATNELKVQNDNQAAAQSAAVKKASALQDQITYAREAFWGGYNAVVDIPIIGPALAPITGATAFAAIHQMPDFPRTKEGRASASAPRARYMVAIRDRRCGSAADYSR